VTILPVVILVLFLIVIYWVKRRLSSQRSLANALSYPLLLLTFVAMVLIAYVDSMDRTYMKDDKPILLTLAIDLSLSMNAIPDPRTSGDVGTRMERVQKVLLPIINAIDASGANVMISITGFTVGSEIISGWDNNLTQVREIIDYVIAPGLLTEPGSDLGAALKGVLPLIDNLPVYYQEQDSRKVLILVSDGEQTVQKADMATALTDLRNKNVEIVALHVGMLDTPEGLAVYDDSGEFMGFQDVGGQIYTVPDQETMQLISGTDPQKGFYVRAESSNATSLISDYIGLKMSDATTSNPAYLVTILALWVLAFAILLWFI